MDQVLGQLITFTAFLVALIYALIIPRRASHKEAHSTLMSESKQMKRVIDAAKEFFSYFNIIINDYTAVNRLRNSTNANEIHALSQFLPSRLSFVRSNLINSMTSEELIIYNNFIAILPKHGQYGVLALFVGSQGIYNFLRAGNDSSIYKSDDLKVMRDSIQNMVAPCYVSRDMINDMLNGPHSLSLKNEIAAMIKVALMVGMQPNEILNSDFLRDYTTAVVYQLNDAIAKELQITSSAKNNENYTFFLSIVLLTCGAIIPLFILFIPEYFSIRNWDKGTVTMLCLLSTVIVSILFLHEAYRDLVGEKL